MNGRNIVGIGLGILGSAMNVHAHSAHDTLPTTWSLIEVLHQADHTTGMPVTALFAAGVGILVIGFLLHLKDRPFGLHQKN